MAMTVSTLEHFARPQPNMQASVASLARPGGRKDNSLNTRLIKMTLKNQIAAFFYPRSASLKEF